MEKKLKKWTNCNYIIEVTYTDDEKENAKNHMIEIFWKDVKIPWFRPGQAPKHLIMEKLNPEYVEMWVYEKLINEGLKAILDENKDIKFIWEPYDLDKDDAKKTISVKLDIYPEVEVKDDKRKKNKMKKIESKATDAEVDDALINLKKNYADYQDTDKIEKDTVSKVAIDFLDKDDIELEKWTVYLWEPEFTDKDFAKFYDQFIWKEKGKDFEIAYKEKDLPPTFHKRKSEKDPKKIKVTVKDIKKVVLPEFTEEKIQKLFPEQKDIKNEKELKTYIKWEIERQKYENELIKAVEEYINDIRWKNMSITIPQTLIQEEFKSRIKSLEDRLWGENGVKQYFQQLWDEKARAFVEDISKAAQDSLEKFFILQQIAKELELDIDWSKGEHLDVEKKLYEKIMWL